MARKKFPDETEIRRVVLKPFEFDRYELVEDYVYNYKGDYIKIPKGFITNGADIPRIFWSIFPPNKAEYMTAVVIHDFLCNKAEENKSKEDYKFADLVFYDALKRLNINKIKAYLFYKNCDLFHKFKALTGLWSL